jgi:hypothetical protein
VIATARLFDNAAALDVIREYLRVYVIATLHADLPITR